MVASDSPRGITPPVSNLLLLPSSDVNSLLTVESNANECPSCSINGTSRRGLVSNLYGRSKETNLLMRTFQRVCNGGPSEVVRIYGNSGTGKSALAMSLQSGAVQIRNAYFVSGKFDQLLQEREAASSHFVLIGAISDLCDLVSSNNSVEGLHELQMKIRQTLSQRDKEILSSLLGSSFVNLCRVQGTNENLPMNIREGNGKQTVARIKVLYRLLVRMLASKEHPVVIFLDDLQWADSFSLEIIDSILSDLESRHLLFVCAFRTDDDEKSMARMRLVRPKVTLNGTNIELENMEAADVNCLLADTLRRTEEETRELSELIHKRTDGNAFFVLQFLETLQSSGLLDVSGIQRGNSLEIKRIEEGTKATDNVGELLVAKLQQLDEETLSTLHIAACIGFTFHVESLCRVHGNEKIESLDASQSNCSQIQKQLDRGARAGLIESVGTDAKMYKFTHDRIQASLYEMIGTDTQKQLLHLHIGRYLWRDLTNDVNNDESHNDLVFLATDQLNCGRDHIHVVAERQELSKLNLRAGKAAKSRSAFEIAFRYFKMGLSLLVPENTCTWERNYGLCLELSNCLAEMALNTGQFAEIDRLRALVEANVRDAEDRFRICQAQIQGHFAEGEGLRAIRGGFRVLGDLGEPMPLAPTKADLLSELLQVKRVLRGKSDEQLLSLPELQDTRKKLALELLVYLFLSAFFVDSYVEKGMMALRMMRLTVKWGYTHVAARAFAFYGVALAIMGDDRGKFRFLSLAMNLMQKDGLPASESLVRLVKCNFVSLYRCPPRDLVVQAELSYKAGMSSGNLLVGFLCWLGYLGVRFGCSCNLQKLDCDMKKLFRRLEEYNMAYLMTLGRPFYQKIHQFVYPSDCPWKLDGDIMHEEQFAEELLKKEDEFIKYQYLCHKCNVSLLYLKFDVAHDIIRENAALLLDEAKLRNQGFEGLTMRALTATSIMWEYEQTGKLRLRRRARKAMEKVKRVIPSGCGVARIFLCFLRAVYAAKVQQHRGSAYIKARMVEFVKASREFGCINFEAFANEYVWDYWAGRQEDCTADKAGPYLTRAVALYREWGALGKVAWLNKVPTQYGQSAYVETRSA